MKIHLILLLLTITMGVYAQKKSFIPKGDVSHQWLSLTSDEIKEKAKGAGLSVDFNADGDIGNFGDAYIKWSEMHAYVSFKYKNSKEKQENYVLFEEDNIVKFPHSGIEMYLIESKNDLTKKLVLYYRGYTKNEDLVLLYDNLGDNTRPRLIEKWITKTKVNGEKDSLNFDTGIFYGISLKGTQEKYAVSWNNYFEDLPISITALEKAVPKGWKIVYDDAYYEVGAYHYTHPKNLGVVALIEPIEGNSSSSKIAFFEKNESNQYYLILTSQNIDIDKNLNKSIKNVQGSNHYASLKFDFLDSDGLIHLSCIAMSDVLKLAVIEKTSRVNNEEKTTSVSFLSNTVSVEQNSKEISSQSIPNAKPIDLKEISTTTIYEYLK